MRTTVHLLTRRPYFRIATLTCMTLLNRFFGVFFRSTKSGGIRRFYHGESGADSGGAMLGLAPLLQFTLGRKCVGRRKKSQTR